MFLISARIGCAKVRARPAPSPRMRSISAGSPRSRCISALTGATRATATSASSFLKAENWLPPYSAQHPLLRRIGQRRIDADEVVGLRPVFKTCLLGGQRLGVGLGLLDLARDGVLIVAHIDTRQVRRVRLRHLLGAVAQAHDPRRRALDHGLGQREEQSIRISARDNRLAIVVVELLRDVARQLQVLLLVLTHRHMRAAIQPGCRPPSAPDRHRARRTRAPSPCRPSP